MSNIHVMIDLETLGTDLNSVIVAIGAVAFNIKTGDIVGEFYSPVDPESCQKAGMVIDASTVMWWLHPDRDEARKALLADEFRNDIFNALSDFSVWYSTVNDGERAPVWGNGCMFDNQIMELAYKRVGQDCPWTFRENRDYRTIKNLLGASYQKPKGFEGVAHQALDDAKYQALHLVNILSHNNLEIG